MQISQIAWIGQWQIILVSSQACLLIVHLKGQNYCYHEDMFHSHVMNIIVSLMAMWYSKGKLRSSLSSYAFYHLLYLWAIQLHYICKNEVFFFKGLCWIEIDMLWMKLYHTQWRYWLYKAPDMTWSKEIKLWPQYSYYECTKYTNSWPQNTNLWPWNKYNRLEQNKRRHSP